MNKIQNSAVPSWIKPHGDKIKLLLLFSPVIVHIPAGACVKCEKVASDLGSGNDFRRVLQCPPPATTGITTYPQHSRKSDENQNSKFALVMCKLKV